MEITPELSCLYQKLKVMQKKTNGMWKEVVLMVNRRTGDAGKTGDIS